MIAIEVMTEVGVAGLSLSEVARAAGHPATFAVQVLPVSAGSQPGVQIDELAGRSPADLTAHLAHFGPKGLATIRRMPGFVRRMPITMFFPEPPLPDRRMSYLFDVLTPRDTWMHRLELIRATGHQWTPHLHDTDIVERVVYDLDQGWREAPFELPLTGPAGGTWAIGTGTAVTQTKVDAIVALLQLSGRGGLDLPPDSPLIDARVVF